MARGFLIIGGIANIAIAILHIIIIFIGPNGYVYFGAPEPGLRAAQGSPLPAIATTIMALLFLIFGLYAFSAAGVIRRLWIVQYVNMAIGLIYIVRGLFLIPMLFNLGQFTSEPLRYYIFSAVAMIIGILYLAGTLLNTGA